MIVSPLVLPCALLLHQLCCPAVRPSIHPSQQWKPSRPHWKHHTCVVPSWAQSTFGSNTRRRDFLHVSTRRGSPPAHCAGLRNSRFRIETFVPFLSWRTMPRTFFTPPKYEKKPPLFASNLAGLSWKGSAQCSEHLPGCFKRRGVNHWDCYLLCSQQGFLVFVWGDGNLKWKEIQEKNLSSQPVVFFLIFSWGSYKNRDRTINESNRKEKEYYWLSLTLLECP